MSMNDTKTVFPTSSRMFHDLVPGLAERSRIKALDQPAYVQRAAPDRAAFAEAFDRFSQLVDGLLGRLESGHRAMYVMGERTTEGWRPALDRPDRLTGLIVRSGSSYKEGFRESWVSIEAHWQDGSKAQARALLVRVTLETTTSQDSNGVD